MDREGWLYILAFAVVIGLGAAFIVPRLSDAPTSQETEAPSTLPPAVVAPEVPLVLDEGAPRDVPEAPAFEVEVAAAEGALRGPLRPVAGARTEQLATPPTAGVRRLLVRPHAERVHFGAVGHRWVSVAARELVADMRIVLPLAAPPLVVRLREADGSPAADVPVLVSPEVPGTSLRTDEGGTIVLDHLAAGLVLVETASAERRGPRGLFVAGRDRDVVLVLDPPWTVRGRIVDGEGKPIEGARIGAFGPGPLGVALPSDRRGEFVWRGPVVARLAMRCEAQGRAPVRLELEPPGVGPLATDAGTVTMAIAGATLEGKVAFAWRSPDARVGVEPEAAAIVRELFGEGHALDRRREVPLEPDGSFVLADLETDLPLRVVLRGVGVPVDERVVLSPGERRRATYAPAAGWSIHGTVVDVDGEPVSAVRLLVSPDPRDGNWQRADDVAVFVGDGGKFVVHGWGHPTAWIRGYVTGWRSLFAQAALPLAEPLRIQLEAPLLDASRRIEGAVVDEAGVPLEGVSVAAAGIRGSTDAEGRFVLDGVESLASRVEVSYGFRPGDPLPEPERALERSLAKAVQAAPGGEPLRLVLPPAGRLAARVVDGITEEPMAFVHAIARSTTDGRVVFDGPLAPLDGAVLLGPLPAEGLDLAFFAGGRRWDGTAVVGAGTTDLGVLRLHRGRRVVGRVLGEDGAPLVAARVGLFDRGWQSRGADPLAERELLFRHATTDAEGRFELEGLGWSRGRALGRFREAFDLAVAATGYAPQSVHVALPAGDPATIETEVRLQRGAFLGLDLFEYSPDPLGSPTRPVHGALVDLEGRDGSNWLDLVHWGTLGGVVADDEDWRLASSHLLLEARSEHGYLVGPIQTGPHELIVTRPGYVPLRERLTVFAADAVLMTNIVSGDERSFSVFGSFFHMTMRPVGR